MHLEIKVNLRVDSKEDAGRRTKHWELVIECDVLSSSACCSLTYNYIEGLPTQKTVAPANQQR